MTIADIVFEKMREMIRECMEYRNYDNPRIKDEIIKVATQMHQSMAVIDWSKENACSVAQSKAAVLEMWDELENERYNDSMDTESE